MIHLACARALDLAERRGELDEAERLGLELHLGACPSCEKRAALRTGVLDLARRQNGLSERQRSRALVAAFDAQPARFSKAAPSGWPWLAAAMALAAVLMLVVTRAQDEAAGSRQATAALRPQSLNGIAAGATPSAPEEMMTGGERILGHARVVALRATTLTWDGAASILTLNRGALRIEVDPNRHLPFRVQTPAFAVVVLGTVFVVDESGVRVDRGKVRIEAGTTEHELEAGGTWVAESETTATTTTIDPQSLLNRARSALGRGEVAAAEAMIGRALTAPMSKPLAAEAHALLAECASVAGNHEEAARRYQSVAGNYDDLPAAETAAFASARAAIQSGDKGKARQLLWQYLARYPKGRFSKEARAHLSRLPATETK